MADKGADTKAAEKSAAKANIPVEKTGESAKTHSVTDLMKTGPEAQKEFIETHKP